MASGNLIDDLVFLARAAAEAGRDWRAQMEEMVPPLVAAEPGRLRHSLHALGEEAPEGDAELGAAVINAVAEALAEVGYH